MSEILSDSGFGDGVLRPFVDSIWLAITPIRFAGTLFPHVMAVVRLGDGSLLLHSPCLPSDELIGAITQIGRVAHVVAPNWFHDLYLAQYRRIFPQATFWAPAFLRRRQKGLIDCTLAGTTRTPWFDDMPHITLSGLMTLDESIFFHRPTRTLIVADLLMNPSEHADAPLVTRLGYRFLGLNGTLRVFPVLQWFSFSCKGSLRVAAHQVLQWQPAHVIVGHGTAIKDNAGAQLRRAFRGLVQSI